MIFIDGSNLFWACRRIPGHPDYKIDILKLIDRLNEARSLVRPYYYCAIGVPPNPSQVRFHHKLRYSGVTVKTKPLRRRGGGWVEKGVDVALVIDLLSMAYRNAYDVAIVVSGDKDFEGAIEEVKRLGKRIELASFDHVVSEDLKMMADKYISLSEMIDELKLT